MTALECTNVDGCSNKLDNSPEFKVEIGFEKCLINNKANTNKKQGDNLVHTRMLYVIRPLQRH